MSVQISMRVLCWLVLSAVTVLTAVATVHAKTPQVQVEALFPDAAVLKIEGQRKMLRVGQSHAGVTLLGAESESATLLINGKEHSLGISRHIGSQYETAKEQVVTIPRGSMQRYETTAQIDGRSVLVLVDTGANVMALSSTTADALGINFRRAQRSSVETASGVAPAYPVTLSSVSVGGITVNNVQALVVEGDYPSTVLLGMSYLRHVKMQEENGILSLSRTP